MSAPAACEPRSRDAANAARSARRAAGLAWARAWRERNRPIFDRLEAEGRFLPWELGR